MEFGHRYRVDRTEFGAARSFPQVMEAARQRMARCECGEETSCYGCLRNFRNQAFHDQLRRGDAPAFLGRLT